MPTARCGRWRSAASSEPPADDLATVWTVRGAPHVYRRADLPGVAAATAPFSDADAGKRIYDASKPLKAAGIANLAALDAVADAMRSIVTAPMVKGECPARLNARDGRAVPAVLPAVRRHPPLRDAVPAGRAAGRAGAAARHLPAGAAAHPRVHAGRRGAASGSTSSGRTCGCSARRRRSTSPATSTPRSRTSRSTGRTTRSRSPWTARRAGCWPTTSTRLDGRAPDATRLLGPFDLYLQAKDRPTLVPDAGPGQGPVARCSAAPARVLVRRRDRRHLAGAEVRSRPSPCRGALGSGGPGGRSKEEAERLAAFRTAAEGHREPPQGAEDGAHDLAQRAPLATGARRRGPARLAPSSASASASA